MILEAVASYDLWIWNAFFSVAGVNNDINVLQQSTIFIEILKGHAPRVQYTVNGNQYNTSYFLADKIYPEWLYLFSQYPYPSPTKISYLQSTNKERERTLSEHLVSCIAGFAF